MNDNANNRYSGIGYDDFRAMAKDGSLSIHERIGFPDSYRAGKADAILRDMVDKMPALNEEGKTIVDIGCGCGELTLLLMAHCAQRRQKLFLVDSAEVLSQISPAANVIMISGRFPQESLAKLPSAGCDVAIAYSMLHYVFADGCVFSFVDAALSLLHSGGRLLLGDIPNISKRKRFFSSATGQEFHRQFTGKDESPSVEHNILEANNIDDAVIFGMLWRARSAGFDSYIVPQANDLPMMNRREDLLFSRP